MNSDSSTESQRSQKETLQTVHAANQIVVELLSVEGALDKPEVVEIANGMLERLRGAWSRYPAFSAALSELHPVRSARRSEKSKGDPTAEQVRVLLSVLNAATRSFLAFYGQPEFGFRRAEGD